MSSQSGLLSAPGRHLPGGPATHLREEFESWQRLLDAQPSLTQRYLEGQARVLADAILQRQSQVSFTLPSAVVVSADGPSTLPQPIPPEMREQMVGGLLDRLTRADMGATLRQRLGELEQSPNRAVAVSAGLLRHATALYMVHTMLPSGRSVTYIAEEDEEIPTVPAPSAPAPESALTAATDAIAEENESRPASDMDGRGELLVPYVAYARKFYLPRWVAFDEQDRLLVNSVAEAEAHIASMQRFIGALHAAVSLAPYMVADDVYQSKRYGMLGQLINQGRALARYQTREIIRVIKQRAAANDLNRGLSLSLPYFDDQDLVMKTHNFEVIPGGRIMFVPAFVVRASILEQAKVAQDTRLSPSTRKHLLAELRMLEQAFVTR
ncbi:MAG: hypothetical protein RMN25_02105 [Anaerolineae bacterium]|nr:hypothetical protein [Thermoflexales bacterium]MDW8406549.1 hypothetical protein [Anaerolineae bacterium]